MGTVQILIVPCGLEVMVSFQIIGEETHAALKGHHHGSGGQIVQFDVGQCSAAAFNEAFDIELIEVQIAPDLGKIRFVLSSCAGTETDGITEIIHCQSRHDGVQIDDTDAFSGGIVNEDVVEFGIIVGNTGRDLPGCLQVTEGVCKSLMIQNKPDLLFYRGSSSANIGGHSLLKGFKTLCRVMKIRNGLMKGFCRKICQHTLEMPERNGTLVKIRRLLHLIVAGGSLYEKIDPPVLSFAVQIIRLSISGTYDRQSLPFRITAVFFAFLFDPLRYMNNVFHKFHGFFKNILIHSLKDIATLSFFCLISHAEGIIDVTASIGRQFLQLSFRQCKSCQNFCCDLFLIHLMLPPKVSEDIFPHPLISESLPQPLACLPYR